MFRVCIQQFQKADNTIALVFAMEGLASLNVNQGQAERADAALRLGRCYA